MIDLPIGIIIMQILALALPVGAVGMFGYLALRFVRAKEHEAALRGSARQDADTLDRLTATVSALQAEVTELRDNQRFLERLLEKPRPGPTSD
jgi:cell division protein FtsB